MLLPPTHTTNYLSNIAVPNCTMTASYTANGSQDCDGIITYYTATSSCTSTDPDCNTAYAAALACARAVASHKLKRLLTLLPPCDGPEPPQP